MSKLSYYLTTATNGIFTNEDKKQADDFIDNPDDGFTIVKVHNSTDEEYW